MRQRLGRVGVLFFLGPLTVLFLRFSSSSWRPHVVRATSDGRLPGSSVT
jgi:hypothetical protein